MKFATDTLKLTSTVTLNRKLETETDYLDFIELVESFFFLICKLFYHSVIEMTD